MQVNQSTAVSARVWTGRTEGEWITWCLDHALLPEDQRTIHPGDAIYLRRLPAGRLACDAINMHEAAKMESGGADALALYMRIANSIRDQLSGVVATCVLMYVTGSNGKEGWMLTYSTPRCVRLFVYVFGEDGWKEHDFDERTRGLVN